VTSLGIGRITRWRNEVDDHQARAPGILCLLVESQPPRSPACGSVARRRRRRPSSAGRRSRGGVGPGCAG